MIRQLSLYVGLVLLASAIPGSVRAQKEPLAPPEPPSPSTPIVPPLSGPESPVLEWDPAWARAGALDYAIIGGAGAVAVATSIMKPSTSHRWDRPLLFDEAVRDVLRLPTQQERYIARDATDVLVSLEATWPVFVDSIIVAYGTRRSPRVAMETAIIDIEALTLTVAVQGLTANLVGRPRPYYQYCGNALPSGDNDCVRNTRFRSFFSGHSALAFTGASLICAHRAHLDLFGDSADGATCVIAYAAAAATATLRVVGDVHYATDVIAGAVVGTAIGLLVPTLHYRRREQPSDIDVSFYPMGAGLGVAVAY